MKRFFKWSFALLLIGFLLFIAISYWRSTNECEHRQPAQGLTMKAIVYCDYGTPDVLHIDEVEKPIPNDNQVLVKVKAASLNPLDGHMLRGQLLIRVMNWALRKPKETRLGVDFAGVVEAVGKNVTEFNSGDEVFGGVKGSLAEYVCVRGDRGIARKPAEVSFEQAAGVGVAGVTALQGLRDKGQLQSGQSVVINGASGGVGTFAVQIAKAMGAQVTGVCSGRNAGLVRSLGADSVIDYTQQDFTKSDGRYNIIFDNVANHSYVARRAVLAPGGRCVLVGIGGAGAHDGMLAKLGANLWAILRSKFANEKFTMFIAELKHADLAQLADLMAAGKVKTVIDRTYKLEQAADALRYLKEGHARGKVIITIDQT